MLDTVIKQVVNDKINELNTTMQCRVVSFYPLTIQPIPVKKYVTGDMEYPLITNVRKLKAWGFNSEGAVVEIIIPLQVNNIVLVAFGKHDLSDAVILGVLE